MPIRTLAFIALQIANFLIAVGEGTKSVFHLLFRTLFFSVVSMYYLFALVVYQFVTFAQKQKQWVVDFKVAFQKSKLFKFPGSKSAKRTRKATKKIQASYFIAGCIATLLVFGVYRGYTFIKELPSPESIGHINYPLSTHIVDRKGRLLYEIYKEQNRTSVKLTQLPQHLVDATIAIEDKDFFNHKGVSLISGIGRALKDSFATGSIQGGSTITQQLVKSALLTPERTIERKLKEIVLAVWAERIFTKRQILELYLNQVPYGGASYGIEEASKNYFGKSAKDLTLAESTFLAGLPQAPTKYSPYTNPKLAEARRRDVLANMLQLKYIDEKTYEEAVAAKLNIIPPRTTIRAPHFVFYARELLEEEYGVRMVEEGGLSVTTTLDLDVQAEAERILSEELEKVRHLNVTNGAVLVTRPMTGEILAMVGSADYFASPSGSFNVAVARRQPGSSIKPLMYSLAIERGEFTAASSIDDTPAVFTISDTESYRPVNYDGKFHGRVPLRQALGNSYNVPAVKVLNALGVPDFAAHAKNLGITTWGDPSRYGLSLTLGSGEVTMVDMATAYGVFAHEGKKVEVTPFLSIDDLKGSHYRALIPRPQKVLREGTAFILSDIMADPRARRSAFGPNSALEVPGYRVAVKTGTTNDKKDNWTIGYTPEFLVTVWVGNNDNTPMHPTLSSGITGAAPIWNRMMTYLLKNYGGTSWYPKPDEVVERMCQGGREYFLAGTESKVSCRDVPQIDKRSFPVYN